MEEKQTISYLDSSDVFPEEMILEIIQYLDLKSLANFSVTNKKFYELIYKKYLQFFKIIYNYINLLGYHLDFNSLLPSLMKYNFVTVIELLEKTHNLFNYEEYIDEDPSFLNKHLSLLLIKEYESLLGLKRLQIQLDDEKANEKLSGAINEIIEYYNNKLINSALLFGWLSIRINSFAVFYDDYSVYSYSYLLENFLYSYIAYKMSNYKSVTALALMQYSKDDIIEYHDVTTSESQIFCEIDRASSSIEWLKHIDNIGSRVDQESSILCLKNWFKQSLLAPQSKIETLKVESPLGFEKFLRSLIPKFYLQSRKNLILLLTNQYDINEVINNIRTSCLIKKKFMDSYLKHPQLCEVVKFHTGISSAEYKIWLPNCSLTQKKEIVLLIKSCHIEYVHESFFERMHAVQLNFEKIKEILLSVTKIFKEIFYPATILLSNNIKSKEKFKRFTLLLLFNFFATYDDIAIATKKTRIFCKQLTNLFIDANDSQMKIFEKLTSLLKMDGEILRNILTQIPNFTVLFDLANWLTDRVHDNNFDNFLELLLIEAAYSYAQDPSISIVTQTKLAQLIEKFDCKRNYCYSNLLKLVRYEKLLSLENTQLIVFSRLAKLECKSINGWIVSLTLNKDQLKENESFLSFLMAHFDTYKQKFSLILRMNPINNIAKLHDIGVTINDEEVNLLDFLISKIDSDLLLWIIKDCINTIETRPILDSKTFAMIHFFAGCKVPFQVELIQTVIMRIGYDSLKNSIDAPVTCFETSFPLWQIIMHSNFDCLTLDSFLRSCMLNGIFNPGLAMKRIQNNSDFNISLGKILLKLSSDNVSFTLFDFKVLKEIFSRGLIMAEYFESLLVKIANYKSKIMADFMLHSMEEKTKQKKGTFENPLVNTFAMDERLDKFLIKLGISINLRNRHEFVKYLFPIVEQMIQIDNMHNNIFSQFFALLINEKLSVFLLEYLIEKNGVNQKKADLLVSSNLLPILLAAKPQAVKVLMSKFKIEDLLTLANLYPFSYSNKLPFSAVAQSSMLRLLANYNGDINEVLKPYENINTLVLNHKILAIDLIATSLPSPPQHAHLQQRMSIRNLSNAALIAKSRHSVDQDANATEDKKRKLGSETSIADAGDSQAMKIKKI